MKKDTNHSRLFGGELITDVHVRMLLFLFPFRVLFAGMYERFELTRMNGSFLEGNIRLLDGRKRII